MNTSSTIGRPFLPFLGGFAGHWVVNNTSSTPGEPVCDCLFCWGFRLFCAREVDLGLEFLVEFKSSSNSDALRFLPVLDAPLTEVGTPRLLGVGILN